MSKERVKVEGLTIDGTESRDLDDAFWLENIDENNMLLHISIADITEDVKPDSLLDKNAQKYYATRYFKDDKNLPMFPAQYSEDAWSLLADVERKTITFSIPIDQQGNTQTPLIQKTYLNSKAKLNYKQAEEIMLQPEHPFSAMLNNAYHLAKMLFKKRLEAGAITIYDLSNGITSSEAGVIKIISSDESYNSHIIIQELMILVNQVIARFFAENEIPALYRNHTAKAVAPEREHLLKEIEHLTHLGDTARMGTLSDKYSLIFNRATYSPIIEGHYALNLPAYLHITSPIRRYSDLVNMQQLSAFLDKKSFPYQMEKLHTLGENINKAILTHQKKSRRFFIKEMYTRNLDVLNNQQDFTDISDDNLYLLLKTAVEYDRFSENLSTKTLNYLKNEKMDLKILFIILFKSPDNDKWETLKIEILTLLGHALPITTSLLAAVTRRFNWQVIQYQQEDNQQGQHGFKTIASLHTDKEEIKSDSQQHLTIQNRKTSQQLANFNLLCKIIKMPQDFSTIYQPYLITNAPTKNEKTTSLGNYASQLNQLCQKKGWLNPQYNFDEQGAAHQPLFEVQASLLINNETYYSDSIQGANKKSIKQQASLNLLEKISHLPASPSKNKKEKNFIGLLNTLRQQQNKEIPHYSFQQIDHHFQCTCTLNEEEQNTQAEAKTKKESKQRAAKAMWLALGYSDA